MCGIAGELSFNSNVDLLVLKKMTDALFHRGPDDDGLFCDGQIGLGHRRLSIIDLSENGRQPMWTEDFSLGIIFNGEVYNHAEIRPELELEGYSFSGHSDTEVVLNAIHFWGLDKALHRFIGMFAFAVWNAHTKKLYLVRDRLGVKPLYYQKTSDRLIFGSELKALYAHPSFQRDLSHTGLEDFFCFGYTLGDRTVFKDTYKIPAGHYLSISANGETTLEQFWSLDNIQRGSFSGSFEDAVHELTELCDSAFAYRLVSDVPVGVFLSGGVDSTFLAFSLKKRLGQNLKHITVGFDVEAYDEGPKAEQVACELTLEHTVEGINAAEAQQALSRFVEIWDEPFGDTSGIPTSILCSLASKEFKVALSADGGDELFCGYESYSAYNRRHQWLRKIPLFLRRHISTFLKRMPYKIIISTWLAKNDKKWNPQTAARFEKFLNLLNVENETDLIRIMNEKGWDKKSVGGLLNTSPDKAGSENKFESKAVNRFNVGLVDRMMRTDLSNFLGQDILTKVDRASMAASLECRDPMLDHRLVEFAFSLPIEYLLKDGEHKHILKQVLKPWISGSVLRAPKRGFSIPLYAWLHGPWKSFVYDYLSTDKIRKVGVLNECVVLQELDDFYRHKGGRAEKIMLMLNFQMWAERWLKL